MNWKTEADLRIGSTMIRVAYRFNKKLAWAVPVKWSIVIAGLIITAGFLLGNPFNNKKMEILAAAGSVVAVLGVLVTLRPFLREEGGYLTYIKRMQIPFETHSAIERGQILLDADAINAVGPALVIVGTLINGFSGFR